MFNVMKTISISALTAIALVGVVSAPAFAQDGRQVQQLESHNNNNNALVGGVLGAVVGGVVGSEVAGRGNRNEGAIIGALVGGVTGAAIGDNTNNQRINTRRFDDRRFDNRRFDNRRRDRRFDRRRFDGRFANQLNSDYYDYNYGYSRNRSFRGSSFDRFGHNRFGSRSSFGRRGGFNSHHGKSFKKLKKLKKNH